MIKQRTKFERPVEEGRTTIPSPKPELGFGGWGPRIRY